MRLILPLLSWLQVKRIKLEQQEVLMVIRIAVTALATVFLGAAAYAVVPEKPDAAILAPLNTTTIEKNQVWPLRGNISLDPCANIYCQNV